MALTVTESREMAESAIRGSLSRGDSKQALNHALCLLQARLASERKMRPEMALHDAELAGTLLALAGRVHAYEPARPAGCPARPRPHDLLTVFQAALDAGTENGEGK
jgi:hypothetical protein